MNHKRIYRLWTILHLTLPKRKRRKRRGKRTSVPMQAQFPNHVWTYDFMEDTTVDGRQLRILTLLDEFTREGLAVHIERSMPARKVLSVLSDVIAKRGAPLMIRSDNGSEFVAHATQSWLKKHGVGTYYIEPGKPWQNAFGESFNATVREEFLTRQVFHTVREAQALGRQWLVWYNRERLHSSLAYQTPAEYAALLEGEVA